MKTIFEKVSEVVLSALLLVGIVAMLYCILLIAK